MLATQRASGDVTMSLAERPADDFKRRLNMEWIDPAYSDIRLGFEVTAYVYVR
ncbi:pyrroloquinoline quinone precursor peptide PqqA [Acinetobacter baumannii]|jgi:coenzyme PQQ precursor peptide PqqA